MLRLLILQGPDKGRLIEIQKDAVLLGREGADVVFHDNTISRRHARIFRRNNNWYLEDLGSSNGTSLGGLKVSRPEVIKQGDQFRLGSTVVVSRGMVNTPASANAQEKSASIRLHDLLSMSDDRILAYWPGNEESVIIATPEYAQAAENLRLLYQISAAISSIFSVPRLLEQLLRILLDDLPIDRGVVFLYDPPTSEELAPTACRFRHENTTPMQVPKDVIHRVLETSEAVLIKNTVDDRRIVLDENIRKLGIRSIACVPIKARASLLGVLYLDSTSTPGLADSHMQLIKAIGLQAGLAIENVRLFDETLKAERISAIGEAVTHLSHYIKNVLQGLRSGADVVNLGLEGQSLDMIRQGWQVVGRNTEKIYDLMINMLAFSKDRQPRYEPVNINDLVRDVLELTTARARSNGLTIQENLDNKIPELQADPTGLHHALLNLVTNALDAVTPQKGLVVVETDFEPLKHEAEIRIRDNGPGISPELRDQLFTPFVSTKGQSGTGLGLAVAHKLIQEHGGSIDLASTPGRGTQFTIRLPIARREHQAIDTDVAPSPESNTAT